MVKSPEDDIDTKIDFEDPSVEEDNRLNPIGSEEEEDEDLDEPIDAEEDDDEILTVENNDDASEYGGDGTVQNDNGNELIVTISGQPEHPMDKNIRFLTQGFPNKDENTKQVQMGVHIEEFTEMLDAVDTIDYGTSELLMNARRACRALAQRLKSKEDRGLLYNLPLLLDAMGDQLVTNVSVSLTHRFDIMGALDEISESNLSKFVDDKPTYDSVTGKLLKGPNYRAPSLDKFLPV